MDPATYKWDIYFSHTERDERGWRPDESGWVSRFVSHVRQTVSVALGERVEIFFDRAVIQANSPFSEYIEAVQKSALMIVLLSPAYIRSKRAHEELTSFLRSKNAYERLFIVEIVRLVDENYPVELVDRIRTALFDFDTGLPLDPGTKEYETSIQQLELDIIKRLRAIKRGPLSEGVRSTGEPEQAVRRDEEFDVPDDAPPVKVGDVLDHLFEVKRFIARDSSGDVFEGCNIDTEERVTIKVMRPSLAGDEQVVAMFRKEARTMTMLQHEALVQYRALATESELGVLYVVTDYIEGRSLAEMLGEIETDADDLTGLLRRLAAGLAAAQRLGAVHREMSPRNVILPDGDLGKAKIIDFLGVARGYEADWETEGGSSGRLNYAAPEQLGDFGREIGPWTDVYSLALVILAVAQRGDVELGASLVDAVAKRRQGPDLSPVPPSVRPLLRAMLRPDPKQRLRSMDEVLAWLDGRATEPHSPEPNTHFVSDDPEVERDELGRGPLAIALGRRLHRIWCRSNGIKLPGSTDENGASLGAGEERAAFVLHLDAPWGGGKTSFANFLARVLNPFPAGSQGPAKFLTDRAAGSDAVGTIFIDDPPADGQATGTAIEWPEAARRPWIIVPFNAWQAEHCAPPWWVFYQAIRKGCFRAVWREGMAASAPDQSRAPPRPFIEERLWNSARLWSRELWWRLRNPKVLVPLATALVAGALVLVLLQLGIVFRSQSSAAFNLSNAAGLLLAAVTGIGSIWAAAALFTESMAPGLDAAAERRNLGSGDPFERFRRHFARTMAAVKRPVMVIVDDLDRCRPDFVVDLVRGIQTLLRSPRVVFVILGDRDWIERAFEAHHDAMQKVNVGPEQTFGARFVEKAIQMSFILPEMPDARQDAYVRKVLLGPGAAASGPDAPVPPPAEVAQRIRADYREQVATAPTAEARKQAEEKLAEKYQPELQAAVEAGTTAESRALEEGQTQLAAKAAEQQTAKLMGEERALLAAVDERMGQALLHRLEPLARFFPANPRQIKRIVNAITMYTCVAYLQMDMDESDSLGLELAIWVIVMTEWPDSWRLLASCPELADVLAAEDHEKALATVPEDRLPGSRASTLREVKRIRADARLLALITEQSPQRPRLRTESVRIFTELTPLYSRLRRLKDEAEAAAAS